MALCQEREKGGSLTGAVDNDRETPPVPKHLSDLFQRRSHLLNPDERSQLATDFADVFAVSSDDLGHTSLVTHHIHQAPDTPTTGSSQPIRQLARRLLLHKRAKAETLFKVMLQKGVIEPPSTT